jgi:alpha/beta superfamily hydrolase
VLTHPHPLHGGSMHATVVEALFRALPMAGVTCLRFNFRGVQGSQGRHGYGRDERTDVATAIEAVVEACPGLPVVAAGWSFGADVALSVDDERIAGWFAVAPPLRVLPLEELVAGAAGRPVLLAVPANDQFCPPDDARRRTAGWASTRIVEIPGADHFLAGHLPEVVDLARSFVDEVVT